MNTYTRKFHLHFNGITESDLTQLPYAKNICLFSSMLNILDTFNQRNIHRLLQKVDILSMARKIKHRSCRDDGRLYIDDDGKTDFSCDLDDLYQMAILHRIIVWLVPTTVVNSVLTHDKSVGDIQPFGDPDTALNEAFIIHTGTKGPMMINHFAPLNNVYEKVNREWIKLQYYHPCRNFDTDVYYQYDDGGYIVGTKIPYKKTIDSYRVQENPGMLICVEMFSPKQRELLAKDIIFDGCLIAARKARGQKKVSNYLSYMIAMINIELKKKYDQYYTTVNETNMYLNESKLLSELKVFMRVCDIIEKMKIARTGSDIFSAFVDIVNK